MLKKYVFVFFLLLSFLAQGQVYDIDKGREWGILGSGAVMNAYFLIKEPSIEKPTTEQLLAWNRSEVPGWERSATYNWSESAASWSDVAQITGLAAPLLFTLSDKARYEYRSIGLMLAETILINTGIVGTLKVSVKRRRPFVFNEEAPYIFKYRRQVYYSFVSGHTSASAAGSFFAAKVFSDLYPDSSWKPWIWTGAALIPAVAGLLRYEAGKHFLTDVAAGYAIGALVGVLVPALHKRSAESDDALSFISFQQGGVGLRWEKRF